MKDRENKKTPFRRDDGKKVQTPNEDKKHKHARRSFVVRLAEQKLNADPFILGGPCNDNKR